MHSLLTESLNRLHAFQASITTFLSSLEYQISPYLVVRALRANETVYILTTATSEHTAAARQLAIENVIPLLSLFIPTYAHARQWPVSLNR